MVRFFWGRCIKFLQSKIFRYSLLNTPLLPGIVVAGLSMGLYAAGAWRPLENLGYNALPVLRQLLPHAGWDSRLVVIAIDDASLQKYGWFPWPRQRYVQLLQALDPSPPAAIGFDILFSEATAIDATLAEAMAANGAVVLAVAADRQKQPLYPVPVLQKVTIQGHIFNPLDADGISRQAQLYLDQFPAFSVALLQTYNQTVQTIIGVQDPPPPILLPPPTQDFLWLNWPAPTQALPTYSFAEVIEGKIDLSHFANKIVLVGITATGFDPLPTPLNMNPPTAGIFYHAAVLDNLLNQRSLRPLPAPIVFLLLAILAPLANWMLLQQTLKARLATLTGFAIVWFLLAFISYWGAHGWLPIAAPIGTVWLTGIGVQLREQHEKQQVMSLFAVHVSPETAALIWQNRTVIFQNGQLEAQELTATVLFSDIRGFTATSEILPPPQLLRWLNRYLHTMSQCIREQGGVIDKYIGDAIMAVFGVPLAHTTPAAIRQDAVQAIAAGLKMYQALQALNQQLTIEGCPTIECGIGIHTGSVIAGSVGSIDRWNYSVIGDAVNVAARLESLNKEINVNNPLRLLISEDTFAQVSDRFRCQLVGTLRLRGREQVTKVYAVLGEQ